MQTQYETARSVLGFIGLIGWLVFLIGVIAVLAALTDMQGIGALALVAGISSAIGGLIQVAIAQVSVAILDMADNSLASLRLQEKVAANAGIVAEPSEAMLNNTNGESTSGAASAAPGADVTEFMNERIEKKNNRYYWRGEKFLTLGKAKKAIKAAKT